MTEYSPSLDVWIVVVEFLTPAGEPVDHSALGALVGELREWKSTALCAPDRYAVQLHVMAQQPNEALRLGLVLHERAARAVGVHQSVLARGEVMTSAEFDSQWFELGGASSAPALLRSVLSDDVYWATRAMFQATTASDLTEILVSFVVAVGGEVQLGLPRVPPGHVSIDVSLDIGEPRHVVVDSFSVSGMMIEHALPVLLDDARAVLARLQQPHRCPRPPS